MTVTHVYPVATAHEHNLEGLFCQCGPDYETLCSQCDPSSKDPCWQCNGVRLVKCSALEARMSFGSVVVVHKLRTIIFEGDDEPIQPWEVNQI